MQSISYCPKKWAITFQCSRGRTCSILDVHFAFESPQVNHIAPCCAFLCARWMTHYLIQSVSRQKSSTVAAKKSQEKGVWVQCVYCVLLCLLLKELNIWRWYHWEKPVRQAFEFLFLFSYPSCCISLRFLSVLLLRRRLVSFLDELKFDCGSGWLGGNISS